MALYDVPMPQMGESIAEGTIVKWHKNIGDKVEKDETILEISTDKVDSEIPSPTAGILAEILFAEDETVGVGTIIAKLETDASASIAPSEPKKETPKVVETKEEPKQVEEKPAEAKAHLTPQFEAISKNTPAGARKSGSKFYSPLVRSIATKEGISQEELDSINGTGSNERVTKNDILSYLGNRGKTAAPVQQTVSQSAPKAAPKAQASVGSYDESKVEIIPMDTMRKSISNHMRMSLDTSAHVQSMSEVDMTEIVKFREANKDAFLKKHGFKLTYTPIILEAVAKAIKDFPLMNSSVDGTNIIRKKDINMGMAVAMPNNGLIVPVIKNIDELNFFGICKRANELAYKARDKKLSPDEVQGGTFTVTNPGIYGNLLGFAVINQPQVGIVGVGSIQKRPVVLEGDLIGIRSMMYLTLAYDHRMIDGAYGGQYLERVCHHLRNFDVNQSL
ncbi:MAG: 2-oxo acid dehydrogenase subunit E2 [Calditrichaeota bacterium]|nr:MAG: 2-oxo acid dehydrogenase subunit E2 [Calditrichota bacterium]